jgi:hypothetical protein
MSDETHTSLWPLPWRLGGQRAREKSGIEPFVRLTYRRRGRSISRVVSIPKSSPQREAGAEELEIYFGLG